MFGKYHPGQCAPDTHTQRERVWDNVKVKTLNDGHAKTILVNTDKSRHYYQD